MTKPKLKTLVAKPDGLDVVLAHYIAGDVNVITNFNAEGRLNPFDTNSDELLSTASAGSLKFSEVAGEYTMIGACEHCSAELHARPEDVTEMATAAMASDANEHYTEVVCPNCQEIATVDAAGLENPELRVEEASEEETQEEAEAQEEASEDEGEAQEEASQDEEGEDQEAADSAPHAQDEQEEGDEEQDEDQDQDDQDQDEQEEDKSSAAPTDFSTVIEKMFADTAAAQAEAEQSTITFDVSSSVEFDPNSVAVTPLRNGIMTVFVDNAEGTPVQIGALHVEQASANNAGYLTNFTPKGLQAINRLFRSALEAGDDLHPFGFKPVVHEIEVTAAVEALATERAEIASVEQAEVASRYAADLQQCVAIAMSGMDKGAYENPLHAALVTALESRRIGGAERIASAVVASAMAETMTAVLATADELMGQDKVARDALAATFQRMKKRTPQALAAEEAANIDMSTAHLFNLQQEQEVEAPAPVYTAPARKKKLFQH